MKDDKNNKLLVILGSTATGKTKLAVKLASQFNGEIVSADSRQVYKGMDIGTGKDLAEYTLQIRNYKSEIRNKFKIKNSKQIQNLNYKNIKILYHLIDVVSPKTEFNLAKYIKLANKAIRDIQKRGKLPILTGGTGLYLQAVVEGYNLSGAKPDKKLRADLEKKSTEELREILKQLDPRFKTQLDNKRYLIRYIEMVKQTGLPVDKLLIKQGSGYDCLVLGINFPRAEINKRIDKRLIERIDKQKMIEEVERLHGEGVSWKRLESFGLEYKFVSQYLQNKLDRKDMVEKLKIASHQFAKRQMTWFRRWEKQGREIKWIDEYNKANILVKKWMIK